MYLVDSSVYIDSVRTGRDPAVMFETELETGVLYTCGVVECEVLRSIRDRQVFARLEIFFQLLHTIEYDSELWKESTQLAWDLDRNGSVLPLSDILIAAAALRANLILITSDKHFELVPGLKTRSTIR